MTSSKGHYIKLLATTKNIKKSCPKIFLHGRESRKRVVTSDQDAGNWDRSGATALRDDDGFVICKEQEQKTKQNSRLFDIIPSLLLLFLLYFFYPCRLDSPSSPVQVFSARCRSLSMNRAVARKKAPPITATKAQSSRDSCSERNCHR